MASGLPWKTSKTDVAKFFANIEIIGGSDGIEIKRKYVDGPNEAKFFVRAKDIRVALAHNKLSLGSRTIHGKDIKMELHNI